MKTNKIIAGVSALVMAAANVCAVSAQSVTEEELNVPVQDDTTVSAPADEEAADESSETGDFLSMQKILSVYPGTS